MKDYRVYVCPFCSCEYYDRTARNGKKIGNPMLECPSCGRSSYRNTILEPALVGGKRCFNIRFSSAYGNFRIGIILVYAVFLFFILTQRSLVLSLSLVIAAAVILLLYEIIRIAHRSIYLKSEEYESEILHSLKRLEDESYAKKVTASQGIDSDSPYCKNV